MTGRAGRRLAVLTLVGLACVPAAGRADGLPRPEGPAADVKLEAEPVRYHRSADGASAPAAAQPLDTAADLSHVVLALAVVIAIIFGLRWVARRMALVPAVGRPGRGVRVLSRTVLSPKQQVLLLQVGKRVLVVGDGGAGGMRPLCEITDPDEVAALVGEARSADAAAAPSKSFSSLFRRAAEPFEATADDGKPALASPAADVPGDVMGLLDKVRGLRQQFDR